jgi:hypothetical protein
MRILEGNTPQSSPVPPGPIVAPPHPDAPPPGSIAASSAPPAIAPSAPLSTAQTVRRAGEFFFLYLVVPLLAALHPERLNRFLLPSLVVGGGLLFAALWIDPTFDRRQLWNAAALRRWRWRVLALVVAFAIGAAALVLLLDPDAFLAFPIYRPALWAAIMLGYPLASVYPQEIIFRTFLFHRYGPLFSGRRSPSPAAGQPHHWRHESMLIAASTAAFCFAHLMFQSGLVLVLTAIGGFVFARTYARSRSTLTVAVEHALYGCIIFTIGLGRHFYLGSVVAGR